MSQATVVARIAASNAAHKKAMVAALRACRATLRRQMKENWSPKEWPETVFWDAFQKADKAIKKEERIRRLDGDTKATAFLTRQLLDVGRQVQRSRIKS